MFEKRKHVRINEKNLTRFIKLLSFAGGRTIFTRSNRRLRGTHFVLLLLWEVCLGSHITIRNFITALQSSALLVWVVAARVVCSMTVITFTITDQIFLWGIPPTSLRTRIGTFSYSTTYIKWHCVWMDSRSSLTTLRKICSIAEIWLWSLN